MKIVIRANGGTTIGMGHVMRCTVLAEQLRTSAKVAFACEDKEEFTPGIDFLKANGYQVILLDPSDVVGSLKKISADALITDSYDVSEQYFDDIKEAFPISGYVDDTNCFRFNVDFLVNQNVYAADIKYDVPDGASLFLGPDFLLLRNEFHNLPEHQPEAVLQNVLITLGGSDNNNLTSELIKEVTTQYPELSLHVVIGPSFVHADELDALASEKVLLYSRPKMSNLMLKMDMAISACGSTIYELASCGVPTLGIVVANNQRQIAEKMHELGLLKYAHNVKDVAKMVKLYDYQARYNMAKKSQRMFECDGAVNSSDKIKALILAETVFDDDVEFV